MPLLVLEVKKYRIVFIQFVLFLLKKTFYYNSFQQVDEYYVRWFGFLPTNSCF